MIRNARQYSLLLSRKSGAEGTERIIIILLRNSPIRGKHTPLARAAREPRIIQSSSGLLYESRRPITADCCFSSSCFFWSSSCFFFSSCCFFSCSRACASFSRIRSSSSSGYYYYCKNYCSVFRFWSSYYYYLLLLFMFKLMSWACTWFLPILLSRFWQLMRYCSSSFYSFCIWFFARASYRPPALIIPWWVPCSTICPWSITIILSALSTVVSLWAIAIVVRPFETLSNAPYIFFSFFLSRALVASSNSKIFGFFNIARAMHSLCFWLFLFWKILLFKYNYNINIKF